MGRPRHVGPTCAAVLTDRKSPDRGRVCGRAARHVDGAGRPVCGYHEPTALAKRVAYARGIALESGGQT